MSNLINYISNFSKSKEKKSDRYVFLVLTAVATVTTVLYFTGCVNEIH